MLATPQRMPRWVLWVTALTVAVLYALLWSPHYYPLSDSSLYLTVAKGLADDRGLDFIRQIHRSIRPFTPMLLAAVIKCGGGIGAIHAVTIALTLVSLGLMFLTLRQWFNERIAYVTTLLTAMSWWTYANTFTIMTEPAFLTFMWASLLALSHVRDAQPRWRWVLVITGALLLGGAWANRVAAIVLIPGTAVGLWMSCRKVTKIGERLGWVAIFTALLGLFLLDYYRPVSSQAADMEGGGLAIKDVADRDLAMRAESGYRWNLMVGVSHPVVQMPIIAGRWVLETLAAGFVYPFRSQSRVLVLAGSLLALGVVVLMIIGVVRLVRSGHWWPVALLTYFFPLWFLWASRVKPRYMVPIAPILFVTIWVGASVVLARLLPLLRGQRGERPRYAAGARWAIAIMLLVSLGLNGGAYGVEAYLRRVTKYDFYDQARQGAFAELIDICAYLRKNTPNDADIWLNRGASRRIIALLSNRDVHTVRGEVKLMDPQDGKKFAALLPKIKGSGYVVALYEQQRWPQFHLPLAKPAAPDAPPRWWQLFEYDGKGGALKPISVPRDREVMDHLLSRDRR
jgi:hypothetical protein